MKRILVLCVLICSSYVLYGQELKFKRFNADMSMTDATQYPKKDANGVNCGLIKLGLVIPDAEFEGDIIATEYKNGEWLIYMMNGANWITIKTPQYLPLRYDINPPIESDVTYVMVVEIPPSDSTDYFLEQARRADRRNDRGKFIQYIEKIPKNKVPSDLLEKYNKALSDQAQNDLINNLKRRTNNFTAIPNRETFDQCKAFITKYPQSEYYTKVSNLLRTEGKTFVPGQKSDQQQSRATQGKPTSVASSKNTASNKSISIPSHKKKEKGESLLSVGVGIEPFLFIPDDYDVDIEDCGIEANAVLRIGRPKNLINGLLGVGVSTGSEIESNLHAITELRLNFGEDDGSYYLGIGADISSESCFKIMAGYCKKKFELGIGVRIWGESIDNAAYIGLRWYLF